MASEYLILSAADRRWLRGLRISAGETMAEKLATFADALEERRKSNQPIDRDWDSEAAQ